ncbi:putative protease [Pseudomonas phage UAVern]|uniref:Protease n=1 Tax=Pseudomonas phage UAVern TaxID=2856997 RepID=A0A975UUI1_9CAUD|nr:putative protease [Pseudomonas phage UAVern]
MTQASPNRILVREETSRLYTIRLSRIIGEADDFEEEFQVLAAAGPQDVVRILINSDGGNVATALLLCKAIRECEAHTVAYIGFMCASSATAIALACSEWEMDDNSSFMIHTATYGVYGKAQELKAQQKHMDKMINRFVENTYAGFLTAEEIAAVLDGKDYWMEGDELAQRLTAYADYRYALEQAEAVDTQAEPE